MINFAGLPSYFWFTSSPPKESAHDDVAYTTAALRQDLSRVESAWEDCQSSRNRDAIYTYLTAVFDLVCWWTEEKRALERARKALRLQNISPSDHDEPFAGVIRFLPRSTKGPGPSGHASSVRAGLQVSFRTARPVHQAQGRHQQVRDAICPVPWATGLDWA
jgi:hypothetical protein